MHYFMGTHLLASLAVYRGLKEVIPTDAIQEGRRSWRLESLIYFSVEVFFGFTGGGSGVRQEGGSDAVIGLGAESSGLEMPTRRNILPMTRTTGRIFTSETSEPP
jgi:hypothetical protein